MKIEYQKELHVGKRRGVKKYSEEIEALMVAVKTREARKGSCGGTARLRVTNPYPHIGRA